LGVPYYCLHDGWLLRAGSNITYSFSPWEREDMGVRRVGGQATMLPNGDTMLTGGSQGAAQMAVLLVWLHSTRLNALSVAHEGNKRCLYAHARSWLCGQPN
jgi:hypothetical protein